jgi:SpoVK/Ycf46/Vps4 family AAA+-type ATPase
MSRGLNQFGDMFEPSEAIEPILARGVRNALTEWLTEIWAEETLREVGVKPRRRAIFTGAPGTGKTTLAHHLSARLGLRMLAIRPDSVLSKWVNETAERMGRLFELCGAGDEPIVLFFDEFDALARQRRKSEQSADDGRNEQVDVLLQRIEQHNGFMIAATNYGEHVDQAIWRRFDMHIKLELPGQSERERILARYLAPFRLAKRELSGLGQAFETASPALMRAFAENLKRALIVGPLLNADMSKTGVFGRLLAALEPHPDLGKPRLWSLGTNDPSLLALAWPLSREEPRESIGSSPANSDGVVVPLRQIFP